MQSHFLGWDKTLLFFDHRRVFLYENVAYNTTCFSLIHAMSMEPLMWKTRVVLRTMFPGRPPCVSPQLAHVPMNVVVLITNM